MVASLLIPPTSSRTLRPVHEAWAAGLCMVEEMLQHLVELAVTATTEEGYPQMLPHMTIGCGRVLVHHATIWAECQQYTSSGVQGQPFVFKFEVIGLALG